MSEQHLIFPSARTSPAPRTHGARAHESAVQPMSHDSTMRTMPRGAWFWMSLEWLYLAILGYYLIREAVAP